MKDRISGRVDLTLLLDSSISVSERLKSLQMRGGTSAVAGHLTCVVLGTPRFDDAECVRLASTNSADGFLEAWRLHGEKLGSNVRGGYAAVLVDAARQTVFLTVDRFAIQTLCYSLDASTLCFSDRADCVEGRSKAYDPQAIFDYLFFHMIPAPRTIFANVRRLAAAHSLVVDTRGSKVSRHWPLMFNEHHPQEFNQARATFRDLIRSAVAEEVEGHSQVGAFLSGGTDSSTVVGMLKEVSKGAPKAYSIGFEAEGYDEMEYARLAARHFGCEHHEYYVTPGDLLASIPAVAQHHDQPFGNSSALPSYYCARMAAADGCTKLLAGDGGDELFGGNSRYAMQKVFNYYQLLPAALRSLIEPFCGTDSLLRKVPGLRQAAGYVRHSKVPMPHRLQTYNLVMQIDPNKILTSDFLGTIDLSEPARHMQATWEECEAPAGLINRMLAYDWRYTLADSDLPKVRGASDMAGVQVGYPMLSDRLADFSMSLEPDWKVRRFKLRWFFKEALRGFLPDAIITKKKQGFGLPFGPWLTRDDGLKQLARDSLQGLVSRGIVRAEFVEALMSEYLPEHPGYYGEMVWILMMLEQWMRGQEAAQQAAP